MFHFLKLKIMKKIVIEVSDSSYKDLNHFCSVSNIDLGMFCAHIFRIGMSSFNSCASLVSHLSECSLISKES